MMLRVLFCWLLFTASASAQASRNFDGTNDEVDMGANLDVTTGNVSVCVWVKSTEDASVDFWLGKAAGFASGTAGYAMGETSQAADPGIYRIGAGLTGVSLVDDGDGALIIKGEGNGSDENMIINLDDTVNTIDISSEAAAADAVAGTVGQITLTTWTQTTTNLNWVASDFTTGVVCRDANHASDTFAADARALIRFIRIPRS